MVCKVEIDKCNGTANARRKGQEQVSRERRVRGMAGGGSGTQRYMA